MKTLYPNFMPYMPPNMGPNMGPNTRPNFMPPPNMMPQMQLARVYIMPQPFIGLLPLKEALREGTVFPNLVKPYNPKKR